MPSEPKRPIEELLEASARARRAEFGPEPEMPNPMRARLHEEIARRAHADTPEPRRRWLAAFWPQISLATAAAALLLTAAVLWLRSERSTRAGGMEIAMQAPAAARSDPAAPLQSLDAPVVDALAKNEAELPPVTAAPAETDRFADAAAAGAPHVASAPAPSESRLEEPPSEVAEAAPAAPPPVVARSFAQAPLAQTGGVQQRFLQTAPGRSAARADAKRQQDVTILNTFDIEQQGERIRIVDEDGSTYTGTLEPAGQERAKIAARKAESMAAARATADAPPDRTEPNEFRFRAEGFNNRLKKHVVFEGNYIPSPAEQDAAATRRAKEQPQAPARVVGKVSLPGEAPIEVDAIAVSR